MRQAAVARNHSLLLLFLPYPSRSLTKTETVSAKLWKLGLAIGEGVKKLREAGGMTQTKAVYVKPKFEQFQFKDGTLSSLSWTYESIEKTETHWREEYEFLENTIKKIPDYAEAFKLISKNYGVSEPQAEFRLSLFAQAVSKLSLPDNQETLVDLITTFVADLEGSPKQWHVTLWLHGVWTVEEEVTLPDGVLLRHPRQSDFEVERPLEIALYPMYDELFSALRPTPSAILELERRAKDNLELQYEVEKLLTILRLFHVGAVLVIRSSWKAKSLVTFGSFSTGSRSFPVPSENYSLNKEDLEKLEKFRARIEPLIPQELVKGGEKLDFIITSIQRYQDGLLKPESAESRISFAIMSLEALLLRGGERELVHHLSQRAAKILGMTGNNPEEVYTRVKRCYTIRSKFVHGEPLERDERQYAAESVATMLNYARASIVVLLQVGKDIKKEQFLELIDKSLLSRRSQEELEEVFKQSVLVQ